MIKPFIITINTINKTATSAIYVILSVAAICIKENTMPKMLSNKNTRAK
jgi:hypothetical protein